VNRLTYSEDPRVIGIARVDTPEREVYKRMQIAARVYAGGARMNSTVARQPSAGPIRHFRVRPLSGETNEA
jgi:hypothetical protein